MITLIRPKDIFTTIKIGSKDIVNTFLSHKVDAAEVDASITGRNPTNVYTALFLYVRNHPELGVRVKLVEGKIMLYRVRNGSSRTPQPSAKN